MKRIWCALDLWSLSTWLSSEEADHLKGGFRSHLRHVVSSVGNKALFVIQTSNLIHTIIDGHKLTNNAHRRKSMKDSVKIRGFKYVFNVCVWIKLKHHNYNFINCNLHFFMTHPLFTQTEKKTRKLWLLDITYVT